MLNIKSYLLLSLIAFSSCSPKKQNDVLSQSPESEIAETKDFKLRFFSVVRKIKKGDLDDNLYSNLGISNLGISNLGISDDKSDFESKVIGGGGEGPGGTDLEFEILIENKYLLIIGGSTYGIVSTVDGVQQQKLTEIRLFENLVIEDGDIIDCKPIYPYWSNGEMKTTE